MSSCGNSMRSSTTKGTIGSHTNTRSSVVCDTVMSEKKLLFFTMEAIIVKLYNYVTWRENMRMKKNNNVVFEHRKQKVVK